MASTGQRGLLLGMPVALDCWTLHREISVRPRAKLVAFTLPITSKGHIACCHYILKPTQSCLTKTLGPSLQGLQAAPKQCASIPHLRTLSRQTRLLQSAGHPARPVWPPGSPHEPTCRLSTAQPAA